MVVEVRARPWRGWQGPVIFTVALFILVGLAMAFLDRPISTFSHAVLHRPGWAVALTKLATLPAPLAMAALVAVLGVWAVHRELSPAMRTVLAAACATLLATVSVILLKHVFGRMWPETWVDNNPSWIHDQAFGFLPFHGGKGFESFPSGHTTRITAPFAVLWHQLPRFRLLWVVPTLLVMVGLLFCDFHWFSDCLAGIWLGSASAWVALLFI